MNLSSTQKVLISIMSLLLLVKFFWLPWQDWQSALIEELQLKEKQLNKMHVMLANKQNVGNVAEDLNSQLSGIRQYIYRNNDNSRFKIQIQEKMQSLASEYNLRVAQFSWIDSGLLIDGVVRETLDLRLSGKVADLVRFHSTIESEQKSHSIVYFNFNFPRAKLGTPSSFSGNLRIEFVSEAIV